MTLILLAVPILLSILVAVCGIGQRSYYIGLSAGSLVLGLLLGLIGRTLKSEALFGVWILIVAAFLGFLLASFSTDSVQG